MHTAVHCFCRLEEQIDGIQKEYNHWQRAVSKSFKLYILRNTFLFTCVAHRNADESGSATHNLFTRLGG